MKQGTYKIFKNTNFASQFERKYFYKQNIKHKMKQEVN